MVTRRLIIVGAGGFGREVLNWSRDILGPEGPARQFGFLDADRNLRPDSPGVPPVLGDPRTYQPAPGEEYVCAIGNPNIRHDICAGLRGKGATFIRLVHPSAIVGPNCIVPDGSIICPRAVLTTSVSLGRDTIVNVGCCLGHDVAASECATFSPNCSISGHVTVGARAFFGAGATVLPWLSIGEAAVVGAGSVVVRNVPPHTTVFGVPARRITSKP